MIDDAPDTALLARAAGGDRQAWGALLTAQHERLLRMAAFRLDPRLRGRIDAADIVQDAFVEAAEHQAEYFRTPHVSLFLWLRGVVGNKLLEVHRHYFDTHKRDAKREVQLDAPASDDTSAELCAHLTAGLTRVSVAAGRGEVKTRLAEALDAMDATDRNVLVLRHFEELSNAEVAQVLGIQERAAAKRYLRALQRFKQILSEMPGGLTELRP